MQGFCQHRQCISRSTLRSLPSFSDNAARPIAVLGRPCKYQRSRLSRQLCTDATLLEKPESSRPTQDITRTTGTIDQALQNQQHQPRDDTAITPDGFTDSDQARHIQENLVLGIDKGVWVAIGLIIAWVSMINITVFHTPLQSLQAVALFWPMMQLHTGIFITAHDAMHGAVAPSNPKLNEFMGRLAGTLYAGLDYDSMKVAHHEHHAHTGLLGKDPDFHAGNPGLLPWAGKFIKKYLTVKQMVILNLMVGAVQISGAPYKNMVIFLLCAGLLSAAQLFYFGTYVPHKPPKDNPQLPMTWERSNPTWAKTRLASFLTCYHFDCHVEHHGNPRLAWYELWGAKVRGVEAHHHH